MAVPLMTIGPPLIRYGPKEEVHVDVPLMYQSFAVDRIHYDPMLKAPSPKGRPGKAWGVKVDTREVVRVMEEAVKEISVVGAVEYREPEAAWAVPLSWRILIIAYVRVSHDASEILPDYGLTEEVRRHIL